MISERTPTVDKYFDGWVWEKVAIRKEFTKDISKALVQILNETFCDYNDCVVLG